MRRPAVGGKSRRAVALVLAALCMTLGLTLAPAHAAVVRSWTGSGPDDRWTNPLNWDTGLSAPQPGDHLVFPASATQRTTSNDFPASTAFGSITIDPVGYTLRGNEVQVERVEGRGSIHTIFVQIELPTIFTGAPVVEAAGNTYLFLRGPVRLAAAGLELTGDGSSQFHAPVGGAGGLRRRDGGSTVLAAANTFTGVVTVDAGGYLQATHDQALGSPAAGTTVAAGGALALEGPVTVSEPLTLGGTGGVARLWAGISTGTGDPRAVGPVELTGPVEVSVSRHERLQLAGPVSGPGAISVVGTGAVELLGANTFTGAVDVVRGRLLIGDVASLGSTAAGTRVGVEGALGSERTGVTTQEPIILDGGRLSVQGTVGGPVQITTLGASMAGPRIVGPISGPGGVSIHGATVFAGANTYEGHTHVGYLGVLRVEHHSGLGTSTAPTRVDVNGTLVVGGGLVLDEPLELLDGYAKGSTVTVTCATTSCGPTELRGPVTIGHESSPVQAAASIVNRSPGPLVVHGPIVGDAAARLGLGGLDGRVLLPNPSTYPGHLSLGNVVVGHPQALGSTAVGSVGSIVLDRPTTLAEPYSGSVLNLGGDNALTGATSPANLDIRGGSLRIAGPMTASSMWKTGAGPLSLAPGNAPPDTALRVGEGDVVLDNPSDVPVVSRVLVVAPPLDPGASPRVLLGADGQIGDTAEVRVERGGLLDLNGRTDRVGRVWLGGEIRTGTGGVLRLNDHIDGAAAGSGRIVGTVDLGSAPRAVRAWTMSTVTFSGTIGGQLGSALQTSENGTVVFDAATTATYPGATTVGSNLRVDGTILVSPTTVLGHGYLSGSGAVAALDVAGGVTPGGAGPGVLAAAGTTFQTGSSLTVRLQGPTPGTCSTCHAQLRVRGVVDLGGSPELTTIPIGVRTGDQLRVVDNDGVDPVLGTFAGLPEGGTRSFGDGGTMRITYRGGDGNDVVLSVEAAPRVSTTTAVAASPSSSRAGEQVTITATVAPASATGPVRFLVDGNAVGTAGLDVGMASAVVTLPAGYHVLRAEYGGDAGHSRSVGSVAHRVLHNDSSTQLSARPAPSVVGTAVTLTATVGPATAAGRMPQGSVDFYDGETKLGTAPVDNGEARYTTSSLPVGTRILRATYLGDQYFAPSSSGTVTHRVDAAPTTTTTTRPTTTTTTTTTPPARSGYWMLGEGGDVYAFGDARWLGGSLTAAPAQDLEPTPSGDGYWIVDAAGHVSTHGDARWFGDASGLRRGEHVTSLSRTPTGGGYWLFTDTGRALAFGDAPHLGDMAGTRLNGPVLDSVPSPSGRGYYMVAADGGIFTFGDARFRGSMGGAGLNAPVQSLVPDGDGDGYWLVASDGGIFSFDSPFHGSMGSTRLNRPISGMVGFGSAGYLMVAEDGGIFTFGSARFHGSLGASPPSRPITSAAVLG